MIFLIKCRKYLKFVPPVILIISIFIFKIYIDNKTTPIINEISSYTIEIQSKNSKIEDNRNSINSIESEISSLNEKLKQRFETNKMSFDEKWSYETSISNNRSKLSVVRSSNEKLEEEVKKATIYCNKLKNDKKVFDDIYLIYTIIVFTSVFLYIFIYIYNNYIINREKQIKQNIETIRTRMQPKEFDVLELMLENMYEIKEYYLISKTHVKSSYILSVSCCICGIVLLALSIVVSLWFKELNTAILAAIGGSITEVFAGTALLVHRSSIKQLNYYYKSLNNNEKFLSLLNIVNNISKEKRDDIYMDIIKEVLKSISQYSNNEIDYTKTKL